MKNIFVILFCIPSLHLAQENISYTSPLSEYISDTLLMEEIERVITSRDSIITILSERKEATDLPTWIIDQLLNGQFFLSIRQLALFGTLVAIRPKLSIKSKI